MEISISDLVSLGLQALAMVGVLPAARRWLAVGRRAKTASLVAQLAQEVLVAVMRRNGASAERVAQMEEAIALLIARLIAAGVDPAKAREIAVSALAGAGGEAVMAEERRQRALADLLKGAKPAQ